MRIAIPSVQGQLSAHFGHCQTFELFDVDTEKKSIESRESKPAPEHQPGLLPAWLSEQGAELIIAGGMGSRAIQLFGQAGIDVVVGAESAAPEVIVERYLAGDLQTGGNVCDH